MKITNFLMPALLSLAVPAAVFGQDPVYSEKEVGIVPISKIISEVGWPTPELKKLTFVREGSFEVERRKVITKSYTTPLMVYNLSNYFLNSDRSLIVRSHQCSVLEMFVYEFHGRIFAYKLTLLPVNISGGIMSFYGRKFIRYFFDQDMDGKFETMLQRDEEPAELDQWVLSQPLSVKKK